MACKELAKHGPLRPEETRGISEDLSKVTELDVNAYGQPTSWATQNVKINSSC